MKKALGPLIADLLLRWYEKPSCHVARATEANDLLKAFSSAPRLSAS